MLAIVIAIMVMLRHCSDGAATTTDGHSRGDTLDVAIEYTPMMCYTYADTLGGYHYDLLRRISALSGIPMKFHPVVTLADALKQLRQGRVDLLAAQFPVTKENRRLYLFTSQVCLDRQVLVQRRQGDGSLRVRSQLQLAGDTVHVVKDSPMTARIAHLSREIGDTIHVAEDPLYGPEQLFLQVAAGEIHLAVINRQVALQLAPAHPDVDISTAISFSQIQAWTLRKDNTNLQRTLNTWLARVQATPWHDTLRQRYFQQ